jgi:hypothetical protein
MKSFFSFCCNQQSVVEAQAKLFHLCDSAADASVKRAFELQLEFLLAEVWPDRRRAEGGPPPLLGSQSPAVGGPPVASFGSYAPANTITTGGYGNYAPVFSPVVHINVPSAPGHSKVGEPSKKQSFEKKDVADSGLQSSVRAYFAASSGEKGDRPHAPQVIDLNNRSDLEVLNHFKLPRLERTNQRSEFINAAIAKAARCLSVHTVPDEAWTEKMVKQAREEFEDAKSSGKLKMLGRGKKREKGDGEDPLRGDDDDMFAGDPSRGGDDDMFGDEPERIDESGNDSKQRKKVARSSLTAQAARPVYSSPENSEEEPNVKMSDLNSNPLGKEAGGLEADVKKQKVEDPEMEEVKKWNKAKIQDYLFENHLPKTGNKAQLLERVQRVLRIKEREKIGAGKSHAEVLSGKGKEEADAEPMQDAKTGELLPMVSGESPTTTGDSPKQPEVVPPAAAEEPDVGPQVRPLVAGAAATLAALVESNIGLFQGREVLKKGEMVVAFHENKITRMEVKSFNYDTNQLIGCAWQGDTDGLTWMNRDNLVSIPIPRQAKYDAGHFVLYFLDNLGPDYQLGQLSASVQLTISGSDVRLFKAQTDGKTNFVFVEDFRTKKTGHYRPQNVIFDAVVESDGDAVQRREGSDDDYIFATLPARVNDSSKKK